MSIHNMEAKYALAMKAGGDSFAWEGHTLSTQNTIDFYQMAAEAFDKYIIAINISYPISILAIIFSVITLFSGIFSQRLCSRVIKFNNIDVESEDQASSFHWFRAVLGISTSLHSVCFLLTAICLLSCKLLLLPWAIKSLTQSPMIVVCIEVVGAAVLVALLVCLTRCRRCLALFSTTKPVVYGINISAQDEPEFWQWLNSIQEGSASPSIDNVVISLQKECYATVAPLEMIQGTVLQGLTLCIPVDSINTLSKRRMAEHIRQALHQPGELAPEVRHDLLESHIRLVKAQNPMPCNRLDKVLFRIVASVATTLAGYFLASWHEAIYQQANQQIWSLTHLTVKSDGSHTAGLLSSMRLHMTQLAQQLPKSSFPA